MHALSEPYLRIWRGRPLLRARPGPRGALALPRELPLVPPPDGRRGLGAREPGGAGDRGRAGKGRRRRRRAPWLGRGCREGGGSEHPRLGAGGERPPGTLSQPLVAPQALRISPPAGECLL